MHMMSIYSTKCKETVLWMRWDEWLLNDIHNRNQKPAHTHTHLHYTPHIAHIYTIRIQNLCWRNFVSIQSSFANKNLGNPLQIYTSSCAPHLHCTALHRRWRMIYILNIKLWSVVIVERSQVNSQELDLRPEHWAPNKCVRKIVELLLCAFMITSLSFFSSLHSNLQKVKKKNHIHIPGTHWLHYITVADTHFGLGKKKQNLKSENLFVLNDEICLQFNLNKYASFAFCVFRNSLILLKFSTAHQWRLRIACVILSLAVLRFRISFRPTNWSFQFLSLANEKKNKPNHDRLTSKWP